MPVGINSNVFSLRALRQLSQSTLSLQSSLLRLSSGLRINSASDDAAGLAVSSALNVSARVFSQGIRNVNDGLSALNIAQSGLENLTTIVTRQRELAEQAANGSLSAAQRQALNLEANALVNEYNRTIATTAFNGNTLFNPSYASMRIQEGVGSRNAVDYSINQDIQRQVGNGTFTAKSGSNLTSAGFSASGDVDGDGNVDIVFNKNGDVAVQYGAGNGTFGDSVSVLTTSSGVTASVYLEDMNGDGRLDIVAGDSSDNSIKLFRNDGSRSFSLNQTYTPTGQDFTANNYGPAFILADLNADGRKDIASLDTTAGNIEIQYLASNGTVSSSTSNSVSNGMSVISGLAAGDLDGDGYADLVVGTTSGVTVLQNQKNGSFSDIGGFGSSNSYAYFTLADMNGDGRLDLLTSNSSGGSVDAPGVHLGNGDGTFLGAEGSAASAFLSSSTAAVTADANGDGILDIFVGVSLVIGNGDGSFKAATTFTSTPGVIVTGDFNGDGALDAISEGEMDLQGTTGVTTQATLDLSTASGALSAMTTLETLQRKLGLGLGRIGSGQSRLQTGLGILEASRLGYSQAASRITDVDVASESASLVRSQILQQVSTSVLAQANRQPEIVLALLRL